MHKPLSVAVVGHTNVGKTSLMRTLTRNSHFGEVSPQATTTKHVEAAHLKAGGQTLLTLFDTPGLEDAVGLFDYLEQLNGRYTERQAGPESLTIFLQSSEAKQRFEQEAKVLKQLLASDAALYVIDARETFFDKYRDEISILNRAGKPLIPVLNYIHAEQQQVADWLAGLAKIGLHSVVQFDTVAPPIEGSQQLFQTLSLMLPQHQSALAQLSADQQQQAQLRKQAAFELIADLLLDVAAFRRQIDSNQQQLELQKHQQATRIREQKTVDQLLKLYAFDKDSAAEFDLPMTEGRWEHDIFSSETLKQVGVKATSGALKGAATGAVFDLATAGFSLGAGTAVGAAIGGLGEVFLKFGRQLKSSLTGEASLTVDDSILRLLSLRQLQLLNALEQRGHAAQDKILLSLEQTQQWQEQALPEVLDKARSHPRWSSMNPEYRAASSERQAAKQALTQLLAHT